MKVIMTGLAMLGIIITTSCSNQDISSAKVPSVVLNTVKEKHPTAQKVEWKKSGELYEAEIDLNDSMNLTVQVDAAGKLVRQKQDIALSEIPGAVLATIQSQYSDYRIDDAERLEKDGIVYYQVELVRKGKKDLDLVFTADGSEDKSKSFWD